MALGTPESRILMTGKHLVCDATCVGCGETVGWKYIAASEASQKYKVRPRLRVLRMRARV